MGQNLSCSLIILLLLDIILFTVYFTSIRRKARPHERIFKTIFTSQKLSFLETMTQTRVYNSKLVLWNRSILSLYVDRMEVLLFIVIFRKTQADFDDTLMKKWQKQLL